MRDGDVRYMWLATIFTKLMAWVCVNENIDASDLKTNIFEIGYGRFCTCFLLRVSSFACYIFLHLKFVELSGELLPITNV